MLNSAMYFEKYGIFYCFALTRVNIPSKLFEGQKTEGMKEDAIYAFFCDTKI